MYFDKVYHIVCLNHKIRFIAVAMVIGNIEFLRGRSQPVQYICIAFKYTGELQFRLAVKLGAVKYAFPDTVEQNRLQLCRIGCIKADAFCEMIGLL